MHERSSNPAEVLLAIPAKVAICQKRKNYFYKNLQNGWFYNYICWCRE
jgi:hypothetical protein